MSVSGYELYLVCYVAYEKLYIQLSRTALLTGGICALQTSEIKRILCAQMKSVNPITKTRLYNFDPLKPHFYMVKLGFTGVYIIFLISAENIDCGYSLEQPRRGGSNEYPQSMF